VTALATIRPPTAQAPDWLHTLAVASLVLATASALWIVLDLLRGHRQHMAIMNVVWPVTALWAGPLALVAYFTVGRRSTHEAVEAAKARGEEPPGKRAPFWQSVGVAATHCGSGCALGDLAAEWFVVAVPLTILGHEILGTWALDFALAFAIGIVFQYLTIVPMRGLSFGEGLVAALKADALSLTAWQVGMYGWMALVTFVLLGHLEKTNPVFWFQMQVAMVAGLLTSYPVNWWLLRAGLKERM
jgi:hypothetical protein